MGTKRLTAEEYTVAWISPLEVEQTAALLMVDEEHERLPQAAADPTVYHLGRIGHQNVVIAGLPSTGNASAATVVTHMRRSFPNLRFGILVGIGGGVPQQTDEGDEGGIRLGDVVVSKPSGSHSGAVQYDRGKAEVGQFVRTGYLTPPPAVLLNAAQMLAAKRATGQVDPIKKHLDRIDTSRPQLRRYQYPGIGHDVLHSANCDPVRPASECGCATTRGQGLTVQRMGLLMDSISDRDQSREGTFIVVHRGTIASGEMVIKNGLLRDYLARQHNVYCFETEAAGAMNDFPCLVVRGVSDYCDAYKNNIWHGYAAAVAAAYARELFFHMPINIVEPPLSTSHSQDLIYLGTAPTGRPDVREIAQWLSDLDFGLRHNDIRCRRQPGTGQWLLESAEFSAWMGSSQNLVFCSGMPGAGKTFLGSLVVDHLTEQFCSSGNYEAAIVCIYCDYRTQEEQHAELVLRNLAKQLLLQVRGPVPDVTERLYLKYTGGRLRPTVHELLRHCSQLLALFKTSFVVIDGLDEHDVVERRDLLHYIFQLYQSTLRLKIFATSRPIPEIKEEFISRGAAEIEIQASGQDIAVYLQAKMHRLPSWALRVPGLFEDTVNSITRASQGMFLLVHLLFESLLHTTSLKAFKRALNDLPMGINAVYRQIEHRIQNQNPEHCSLARFILDWITFATRVVTVRELQTALSLEITGEALDDEGFPELDTILAVCCGLIEVDRIAQTVRYAHYTAKQYFESSLDEHNVHPRLAKTCLVYLSLEVFATGACSDDDAFETRLHSYSMYNYASQAWGHHAKSQCPELLERIFLFLSNKKALESASQALTASKLYPDDVGYSQRVPKSVTPAHLVSYFGLEKAARQLSKTFANTDFFMCDSEGKTSLAWAAQNGHVAVVEYILSQNNSTLRVRDRTGSSPLLLAAQRGHTPVVCRLLHHDPMTSNVPDYFQRTPLWHAADKGHVSVVDALLSSGGPSIHIDAKDIDGCTPLIRSSANGHTNVVARLVASGADVNAREARYGRTGFIWASLEGHSEIVHVFMNTQSVEWDALDLDGRSALWWASEEGHTAVLCQLLSLSTIRAGTNHLDTLLQRSMLSRACERGDAAMVALLMGVESTDPNLRDEDGLVPLAWAARGGHNEIVSMLLETGRADINAQSLEPVSLTMAMEEKTTSQFSPSRRKGQTPVSHAAEMGHQKIVQILLDHEADINAPDRFGKTPLLYALESDNLDMMSLLLSRGANPNRFNHEGETPLTLAVKGKKTQVVRLLLANHEIDPSIQHRSGHSAVWWAIVNDDIAMLDMLQHGGRVDRNLREDATLLPMAARIGNKAAVRWLISLEDLIDPDRAMPADGRSALCCAAFGGHGDVVRLLLETGRVDTGRKDNHGRSVLSWATTRETTQVLLDAGADPNERDHEGRTPLSYAVQENQRDKVEALLQDPRTNVNLGDSAGNTPMFYVGGQLAEASHGDMVTANLQTGIPENTMLDAKETEAQSMAELLIGHGADHHATNLDGCTALFFAVRFQRRGLAVVLQRQGLALNMLEYEMIRNLYSSEHSGHETYWPDPDMDLAQADLSSRIREQWVKVMNEDHGLNGPDRETEPRNIDLLPWGLTWPDNLDDLRSQPPLGSAGVMGLHEVGLSHQRLSSSSNQWQRIFGEEGSFESFRDDLEEAHQEKRIREMPGFFKAPTLGRRFPRSNK
ncbi:Pfs, NACHT and Ankyrin domain protein [Aspergillus foveolatus]|uniref:Pfs, NACHT and Ankyrin domain protein n=1 Tax=Aspergillus foveolatus TaxID=210207 RepID=UPI003CCCAEFF